MEDSTSGCTTSEYTGNCNITRMVWNIEGTETWHAVRAALLNPEGQKFVEYTMEDIEDIAMNMVRSEYRMFSLKQAGRKMFIRAEGSCNSLNEFFRSWAAALIGSGTVRVKPRPRSPANEMNMVMRQLSPDFELVSQRLIVAHTMLIAQTGKVA